MKRIAGTIAGSVLLAVLLMPAAYAATKSTTVTPAPSMSAAQSRLAVQAAIEILWAPIKPGMYQKVGKESLHISRGGIVFNNHYDTSTNGGQHRYTIVYTRYTSISAICYGRNACSDIASDPPGTLARSEGGEMVGEFMFKDNEGRNPCSASCYDIVLNFATALNSLHAIAVARQNAAGDLHRQAADWRALSSKPPLPEEVRTHRILAENAVKEKKLDDALEHYEAGLDLFYAWPQGHFNAALISAELGFYEQAVEHMQSYLELTPDAPDAEAARDQIVIWRDKAK